MAPATLIIPHTFKNPQAMLNLTRPLLLPLRQPYPLIAHDGNIYAQMAALLIQGDDGDIHSYPVLKTDYLTDGQVFSEDVRPGDDPAEHYFKIGCNTGDGISWRQFTGIAQKLFNRETDCTLTEIFEELEYHGVTVEDRPKDLFVFISSFDNGVEFHPGEEMAFKWGLRGDSPAKEDIYRDFIEQVAEHLELLPGAEMHFLHNREDDEFLSGFNRLKSDVASSTGNERRSNQPTPCFLRSCEYAGIAKHVHEKWLARESWDKDEMLQDVCRHFGLSEKCKAHLWEFVARNFNVDKLIRGKPKV